MSWEQKASFVINDDTNLMENIFNLIKSDPNSVNVLFWRNWMQRLTIIQEVVAGKVLHNGAMEFHEEAKSRIINQFADGAYPHRVNMAYFQ